MTSSDHGYLSSIQAMHDQSDVAQQDCSKCGSRRASTVSTSSICMSPTASGTSAPGATRDAGCPMSTTLEELIRCTSDEHAATIYNQCFCGQTVSLRHVMRPIRKRTSAPPTRSSERERERVSAEVHWRVRRDAHSSRLHFLITTVIDGSTPSVILWNLTCITLPETFPA